MKTFVDAFADISSAITGFLFGWIEIGWLKMGELEGHLVFLTLLLCGSVARSSAVGQLSSSDHAKKGYVHRFLAPLFGGFMVILIPVLFAVFVVPGVFGFYAGFVVLLAWTLWAMFSNAEDDNYAPASKRVRSDLIWTFATTAAVVLAYFAYSVVTG